MWDLQCKNQDSSPRQVETVGPPISLNYLKFLPHDPRHHFLFTASHLASHYAFLKSISNDADKHLKIPNTSHWVFNTKSSDKVNIFLFWVLFKMLIQKFVLFNPASSLPFFLQRLLPLLSLLTFFYAQPFLPSACFFSHLHPPFERLLEGQIKPKLSWRLGKDPDAGRDWG